MTTPTLNEAPLYGSDFARGMRIEEANKVALHVSGTASIDEAGRTVHREDIDAQADRMLVNVATLLERFVHDFLGAVDRADRPGAPAPAPAPGGTEGSPVFARREG